MDEAVVQTERIMRLCDTVRQTAYEIHCYLKNGHLEKVYENALAHRLKKLGFSVEQQVPLPVFDIDGFLLGDFYADLFVENCLIIELKACRTLCDEHTAQLLGYLRASHIEHGMLLNFAAPKFQVRKYVLSDSLS